MEAFVKPAGAETAPSRGTRAFAAQDSLAGTIMTRDQYANAYGDGFAMTTKFLVSRGINVETAEEAAQAAWVKGWEHRDKLRDPERVLSWVNTIALNVFRNWFRRREAAELPVEIPVQPHASPQLIDVGSALAKCAPADREMIEKHYLEGYTSAELGRQMGCTAVAVRVRMLRARRRLRETIA
jgi:RNA polymerase sigma-70 factor (ECF subfamily)